MMDGTECDDEGMKKHSAGSKNSHPIGTKKAKQMKRVEDCGAHWSNARHSSEKGTERKQHDVWR